MKRGDGDGFDKTNAGGQPLRCLGAEEIDLARENLPRGIHVAGGEAENLFGRHLPSELPSGDSVRRVALGITKGTNHKEPK